MHKCVLYSSHPVILIPNDVIFTSTYSRYNLTYGGSTANAGESASHVSERMAQVFLSTVLPILFLIIFKYFPKIDYEICKLVRVNMVLRHVS